MPALKVHPPSHTYTHTLIFKTLQNLMLIAHFDNIVLLYTTVYSNSNRTFRIFFSQSTKVSGIYISLPKLRNMLVALCLIVIFQSLILIIFLYK